MWHLVSPELLATGAHSPGQAEVAALVRLARLRLVSTPPSSRREGQVCGGAKYVVYIPYHRIRIGSFTLRLSPPAEVARTLAKLGEIPPEPKPLPTARRKKHEFFLGTQWFSRCSNNTA